MFAAILVMLLGAGICTLGVFEISMYFVGVVIFGIGAIGLLVWAGDRTASLVRWWLRP